MASRRSRIKPVANVPVRRGKVNNSEDVRTDGGGESGEKEYVTKSEQEKGSDTLSVSGNSLNINSSPCEGSEQNDISHNVIASSFQRTDSCLEDVSEMSSASLHDGEETLKSPESISVREAEVVASESAVDKSLISGTTPVSDKVAPGLVRNHVRPPVTIPAVARRPREFNKIQTDNRPESISVSHNVIASSSQRTESCLEGISEVSSASLHDVDETLKSQKSISVGKTEVVASESAVSKTLMSGTTPVSDKVPPGLIRKRVKPSVTIPAVARRPRELNKIQTDNRPESISVSHNVVASSSQRTDSCLEGISEMSSASLHGVGETLKSQESISVGEAEVIASESAVSKPLMSGTTAISDKVAPGLVRNRVKPPVTIPAVARRPRELNKIQTDNRPESISSLINCNRNIQEEDVQQSMVTNESVSERASIFPCYQKGNNEASFSGGNGICVGVPGITQIIPTGTAIRPQHGSNIGVSTQLDGNGEASQSLPEPDLPSEGAGGGHSNVLQKPSFSQRSRFIKPIPQILDPSIRKRKFMGSSTSNCESDDSSQAHSSEKQRNGASASESEDRSKRCISDANGISPPVRKSIETPRGRFVKQTPRFIEASVRRHSVQSNASETEEEFCKRTSLVTSPHKRHADLTSEEPVVKTSDAGCSEEADKKVARVRRVPSSCMQRMARARQEFQNKFGNQTPDRSRLTMFDLIFYNPTTNPMRCSEQASESLKISQSQNSDELVIEERLAEEQADEPAAVAQDKQNDKNTAEEEEEEDDTAMPVPQVKVGPDGQIVLDEKSLVIEMTGAKKSREELANSAVIVDYGTGSAGYGTYRKRRKNSKEWSKEETLKFYRALNTVGTDFLLMQSIFPKRTRQDLKMKFKKEDRTNRFLVEKALRYPLDFDLTELEKDLEKEEEEVQQKKLQKLRQKKIPCKTKKEKKSARKSFLFSAMDPEDTGDLPKRKKKRGERRGDDGLNELNDKGNAGTKQHHKESRAKLETGESCSSLSDNEIELEFNYSEELKFVVENVPFVSKKPGSTSEGSDNEEELNFLSKPPKPTRSGRIPQPKKRHQIEDDITLGNKRKRVSNSLVSARKKSKSDPENQLLPLEDLTNVESGSLVVVATQSPTNPSHHVYKVFMVAPKPSGLPTVAPAMSAVPVSLPPTIPQSVTDYVPNSQSSGESQPINE